MDADSNEEFELLSVDANSSGSDSNQEYVEGTLDKGSVTRDLSQTPSPLQRRDNENSGPSTSARPMQSHLETEITLSDDEAEDDSGNASPENGPSEGTVDPQQGNNSGANNPAYGLRKRKEYVNYQELDSGLAEDDDDLSKGKTARKDVLDVFNFLHLSTNKRRKRDLDDRYTKCHLLFQDGTDSDRLNEAVDFFKKYGGQFEDMLIKIRYDVTNYNFLKQILQASSILGRLNYKYHNRDDAYHLLKLTKKLLESNHLQGLHSLNLRSASGEESLAEREIAMLSEVNLQLRELELGDAIWEDCKSTTIEAFLQKHKSSLETLTIHGGFRGSTEKERILITIPKMEALKTLRICPIYSFLSEIKNPHSKKVRVIHLDKDREEPYKISIKFECDLPKLKTLILGNMIELEDLLFSNVRKLTEFRCGSHWNLSIRFPSDGSRIALMESTVTTFQFPDALKDPSFPVKVAKHFPHLKKVKMFLPSVPVLRAVFKAFENSEVEELYLMTQFDFESTMESCLLPAMRDVLRRSAATDTLVDTLKQYKHFNEYVNYYNIELPVEQEDLMEGHSAGIRALKNLKILSLEHVPRKLLIPIPDDERKWYDHNCKFMSTTFGYERYPMSRRCYDEILRLNLSEYKWKNFEISCGGTDDFYEAGFVDMTNTRFFDDASDNEEDLFVPVRKPSSTGTQVKIMPSMLFPDIKIKPE